MLVQMAKGQFPTSLTCELVFDKPSIEGAYDWEFHKQ